MHRLYLDWSTRTTILNPKARLLSLSLQRGLMSKANQVPHYLLSIAALFLMEAHIFHPRQVLNSCISTTIASIACSMARAEFQIWWTGQLRIASPLSHLPTTAICSVHGNCITRQRPQVLTRSSVARYMSPKVVERRVHKNTRSLIISRCSLRMQPAIITS